MAEEEPDYSSLPLTERFAHKVWKVRKQAYEEAAAQFGATPDESDPAFRPFLQDSGLWKGAVADSNVAAQQEGINALCAFLKFGGPQACTRTRNHTVQPIVEKGLVSTRAATKASSLEALLLYVELDAAGPIIEDLVPALSHKQPKIIAAALSSLTSLYHAYGCKIVDPKPALKALPKVFGHADKNVRAEAQNLATELYRWLREAMKPTFWDDLKPVQQTDMEKLFEKVKDSPPPKQERLLRTQQAAMAAAAHAGAANPVAAEEEVADEPEEEVALDIYEPVDAIRNVPGNLQDNLASTKWKDRKDALDALFAAINHPRLQDADYGEICRSLAKCMKDANIACVTTAANCVEALAKGLRRNFSRYRSTVMSPIMERLKEKKQSVADALGTALDAVFTATSLSECLEDTLEFLKHKNPQVKLESVKFLIRCLRATRDVPSKPELKSISESATKLLTESSEGLRSGAAEVLGTLMKILGERAMGPYLEGLDDIRKTKIREYSDTADVKAKEKAKPAPAAVAPRAAGSGGGGGGGAPSAPKKLFGRKAEAAAEQKKKRSSALLTPKRAPNPEWKADDTVAPEAPLPPRPNVRTIPSKLGAPKSGLAAPSGGLKLQKRLPGPASATSPRRPTSIGEAPAETTTPVAAPKFGPSSRGLAGRPLGKPGLADASAPAQTSAAQASSNLSAYERQELSTLRAQLASQQTTIDDLRSERSRMHSQIHELQNSNAQLIEDHTRDVLTVKAKETQLVRARSDAEARGGEVERMRREVERMRRELGRMSSQRGISPVPADISPGGAGGGSDIYRDSSAAAGGLNGHGYANKPGNRASYVGVGEEKENGDPDANPHVPLRSRAKIGSPTPPHAAAYSRGTSGAGDSRSRERDGQRDVSGSSAASGSTAGGGGEGIESWKRAAEVTSQLKKRIELMKARQGISKP